MRKMAAVFLLALGLSLLSAQSVSAQNLSNDGKYVAPAIGNTQHALYRGAKNCPRSLGCGCNLANYFHIAGKRWRELWVARNWRDEGRPAAKGCVGCVAVLKRGKGGHVGVVRSYDANGNPVIYSYANGRLGWTTTAYDARRVITYRSL